MSGSDSPLSSTESVIVRKSSDGILFIGINRPEVKNAIDTHTARHLAIAFEKFEQDSTAKVCIFHGSSENFCTGFDLREVAQSIQGGPSSYSEFHEALLKNVDGRNHGPIGPSRMSFSKPVICAIAGYAVAGGLELSLLGDLRIVEEDSVFGVFSRQVGVPLIDGGTVRLQAIVGLGRALDILLTGRPVKAYEALAMGLANRVVPRGKALEEAEKTARQLLRFPQACMNADRASCYHAMYEAASFDDALRFEFEGGKRVIKTEGTDGALKFVPTRGRQQKL
ncbi:ClpP/crotonase-like domain-containing protein [Xylogone sp. PMI_703]|nr:ClpP/crotonase-like domain-containing protein [Xylogone sp. PMI_703]